MGETDGVPKRRVFRWSKEATDLVREYKQGTNRSQERICDSSCLDRAGFKYVNQVISHLLRQGKRPKLRDGLCHWIPK